MIWGIARPLTIPEIRCWGYPTGRYMAAASKRSSKKCAGNRSNGLLFCERELKSGVQTGILPEQERRMRSDRNRRIEQRAHEIWEAEGRPHGKHDEHWHRAEREIAGGRGGTGGRAAGSGGKSTAARKASPAKARAKTDASAKKAGGATSRTAKPAASAGASGASGRGRRKQPSGTP